jgi:3-phenylpropionate/trans-cinnamate dioxygenase ferredoxin reductase component
MGVVRATVSTALTAMGAEGIVIVGAGPGGLATARSYREHGGEEPVTLIGEEPTLPYERPPLTKEFMRGELEEAELLLEQPGWFENNDVRLLQGTSVRAIDPRQRRVFVEGGGALEASSIVLATGSEPLRPSLPGFDHPSVLTMRMLSDSRAITACADSAEVVIVIGTGFIGCEIAASLTARGAQVKLIGQEALPQEARLGADAGQHIAGWLRELGVELIAEAEASAVHDAQTAELADGRRIEGSCVVLGMGARPRGGLAESAGLQMRDGAVVVDETLRAPGHEGAVLAVGDVAHALNTSAGRSLLVEHWGDALDHGALAGRRLACGEGEWDGVPGFWSTIGERTLKYAAWGDGYERSRVREHANGGFTVWYSRDGAAVGVLTHECDEDYERGRELIGAGEPAP